MNPQLDELIAAAIDNAILDLDICLPCTINAFNREDMEADVSPDFLASFANGTTSRELVVRGVPIIYPMSSVSAIQFDIKKGDKGLLVVAQRSLDNWKSNGLKTPIDGTFFQLSSAFLIPSPTHKNMTKIFKKSLPGALNLLSEKHFIGNPDPKAPGTAASSLANGNVDVLALLDELIKECANIATAAGSGSSIPILANIKADLGTIMANPPS